MTISDMYEVKSHWRIVFIFILLTAKNFKFQVDDMAQLEIACSQPALPAKGRAASWPVSFLRVYASGPSRIQVLTVDRYHHIDGLLNKEFCSATFLSNLTIPRQVFNNIPVQAAPSA